MAMKQPYRIVIVSSISREPSDPQMAWMQQRLREFAGLMKSLHREEGIQVLVYPMAKTWEGKLPHWAKSWVRVQGTTVDLLQQVHVWANNPDFTAMEAVAVGDEVWCLNAPGHGQMSNSPPAKVWSAAQAYAAIAAKFKLVPSWVLSEEPQKPAKEKQNAKTDGYKRNSPAPARKAGGGRPQRGGKERGRGMAPGSDSSFPWEDH